MNGLGPYPLLRSPRAPVADAMPHPGKPALCQALAGAGGDAQVPSPHRPALCEGRQGTAGNDRGLICAVWKASLRLKKKMEGLAENEKEA